MVSPVPVPVLYPVVSMHLYRYRVIHYVYTCTVPLEINEYLVCIRYLYCIYRYVQVGMRCILVYLDTISVVVSTTSSLPVYRDNVYTGTCIIMVRGRKALFTIADFSCLKPAVETVYAVLVPYSIRTCMNIFCNAGNLPFLLLKDKIHMAVQICTLLNL